MRRITRSVSPVCAGIAALLSGLSGCTADGVPGSCLSPGPTATSTAVPDAAARLAERYRRWGGLEDVYGIRRSPGPDGAPLLVVWRRDEGPFGELQESVIGFVRQEEGLPLARGYLMDVFGADGGLRNRFDARP
ncbi:hypothetical protein GCM10010420_34870 [Streptomyces glaucosporus]|uniref:Lipoprotein n=1 Tax=Streptomyces glaucosporus TaxID=284044 RepID=A0ABN3IGL8_9ACTN